MSDVPNYDPMRAGSDAVASSDISQDLIVSTRHLEQHFKDKYVRLRQVYEQRIRQLTDVVTDTCASLFTDEMVEEMRADKTSSAFLPNHLYEVINKHLESERERFIHTLVSKLGTLEVDMSKSQEIIASQSAKMNKMEAEISRGRRIEVAFENMREKLSKLEDQYDKFRLQTEEETVQLFKKLDEYKTRSQACQEELEDALEKLAAKTQECDELYEAIEGKTREVDTLELAVDKTSQSMTLLENASQQERSLRMEAREQINLLNSQKELLLADLNESKARLSQVSLELERSQQIVEKMVSEEKVNKERVGALMQQIEGMLAQEASESNAAIVTMHDKMKQLRHRLTLELQREKRISNALQEEVTTLRIFREDKLREIRYLTEEEANAKAKLLAEQQKLTTLQNQFADLVSQNAELKAKALDCEVRLRSALEKVADVERTKWEEVKNAEERIKISAEKELEAERQQIAAYRIQLQAQTQNHLRHSYTFGSKIDGLIEKHSLEMALKKAREEWVTERATLERHHSQVVNSLQQRLHEASDHIEALKNMVTFANSQVANSSLHDDDSEKMRRLMAMAGEAAASHQKIQALEAEAIQLRRSEGELSRLKAENASLQNEIEAIREDSAQDMQMLSDMQKKFDTLMRQATQHGNVSTDVEQAVNAAVLNERRRLGQAILDVQKKVSQISNEMRLNLKECRSALTLQGSALGRDVDFLSHLWLRTQSKSSTTQNSIVPSINHNSSSASTNVLRQGVVDNGNDNKSQTNGDRNGNDNAGVILDGVIKSLVSNAILTEEEALHLRNLTPTAKSTATLSELAANYLSVHIMKFVGKLHQVHKNDALPRGMPSQSLIHGDNVFPSQFEDFGMNGGAGGGATSGSPISSTYTSHTYTSKIVDAAVSEIEQCRQEQALLVQLSELEAEAQTKLLQSHIDSINRENAAEIQKLKRENEELQASFKKMMEEELNAARNHELARLQTVTSKLKSEQTRRTQLQTRLAELEKVYQTMIAELERKNEELTLRANVAETELIKLRKEASTLSQF